MAVKSQAAQDFVPIKEVRDGIITLKDGSMCSLILASSINLSLKSSDEQQAIINGFQTFLNSLDFSLQIVVQSRRLDIKPYLIMLEEKEKKQIEPLLKIQTKEYMEFIKQFTDEVAIMKKSFVLVVPYGDSQLQNSQNIIKDMFGKKSDEEKNQDKILAFEEKRTQLEQRIAVITQGLGRIGVRSVQLGTEEIVELFYKIFNPGETTQSIKVE
jgi:hypothetical protein